MKKILLLSMFLLLSISCSTKLKTMTLGNITLKVPNDMKRQNITVDSRIIEVNNIYDTYIYKDNNAAYSIVYSKYKEQYSNLYNLYNSAKNSVNSMKNNPSFKNFEIISSEEITINGVKGVITTSEFVYGIYKTRAVSLILVDNFMFQLVCIYTKKHKASKETIDKIIKSISIK